MSDTYEYEPVSEGITFKKVGHFFKVGWLRMIIYVLVMCVVTAIVVLPIKSYYKSEQLGTLSVEFIYDGIEKGEDPNGGAIDTDNIISVTVLSKAVAAAGLTDIVPNITELRNAIRVEGVTSEEYEQLRRAAANGDQAAINALRTYEMHSTRFDIIISEPKKLGLTDDQTVLLLNKIFSAYCDDFQTRYSLKMVFAANVYNLSGKELFEYTDVYDTYVKSMDSIDSYLAGMAAKAPDFVSTQNDATFDTLRGEIAALISNLDKFNSYITANNVWRNKALAKSSLAEKEKVLTADIQSLNDYYDELTNIIAAIKPNTTVDSSSSTGTTTTVTVYPKYYEEYLARQVDTLDKMHEQTALLNTVKERNARINDASIADPDESVIEAAHDFIVGIEAEASALVNKINAAVSDFSATKYVAQSVKQVLPATVTNRTADFNVLLVFGCAVLFGLLVACIVTAVKIAKGKDAKAPSAVAAEPETEATAETEQKQ